jgi:hypothetical protein
VEPNREVVVERRDVKSCTHEADDQTSVITDIKPITPVHSDNPFVDVKFEQANNRLFLVSSIGLLLFLWTSGDVFNVSNV